MLHVGRDKVYYLLRTGQLRSLKIGKLRRITEQQGREQWPVRPVQVRAAWLPPLQDGELVAQEQDLCDLPCFLTPGQPQT